MEYLKEMPYLQVWVSRLRAQLVAKCTLLAHVSCIAKTLYLPKISMDFIVNWQLDLLFIPISVFTLLLGFSVSFHLLQLLSVVSS